MIGGYLSQSASLNTAPVEQAAVKPILFYQNDTMNVFFFVANKNNDNVKVWFLLDQGFPENLKMVENNL